MHIENIDIDKLVGFEMQMTRYLSKSIYGLFHEGKKVGAPMNSKYMVGVGESHDW